LGLTLYLTQPQGEGEDVAGYEERLGDRCEIQNWISKTEVINSGVFEWRETPKKTQMRAEMRAEKGRKGHTQTRKVRELETKTREIDEI